MTVKRRDVTMDTLREQGYKAAYVPDDNTLVYCRDQFTIDEMTKRYVMTCHDSTPIRFVDKVIGGTKYRLTQPIRNWYVGTLWFAKAINGEGVGHDAKTDGGEQPQAEKTMYVEPFRDYDTVTRKGLEREFAR